MPYRSGTDAQLVLLTAPDSAVATMAVSASSSASHQYNPIHHNHHVHSSQPDQPFVASTTSHLNTRPTLDTATFADGMPHLNQASFMDFDPILTRPLEFSVPRLPVKARKRHKVATSCNRCRQNKRKCDSGVPCSNCKKNNVDCCYTHAQLSRSIWGDSPLSPEKVIGVAASRPNTPGLVLKDTTSTPTTPTTPTSTTPTTHQSHYDFGPVSPHPISYAGQTPNDPSGHHYRSQQVLTSQSKQLSKAMRIVRPDPQYPARLSNMDSNMDDMEQSKVKEYFSTGVMLVPSNDMTGSSAGQPSSDNIAAVNNVEERYTKTITTTTTSPTTLSEREFPVDLLLPTNSEDYRAPPSAYLFTTTGMSPLSSSSQDSEALYHATYPNQQQQHQQFHYQRHHQQQEQQRHNSDLLPPISPRPRQEASHSYPYIRQYREPDTYQQQQSQQNHHRHHHPHPHHPSSHYSPTFEETLYPILSADSYVDPHHQSIYSSGPISPVTSVPSDPYSPLATWSAPETIGGSRYSTLYPDTSDTHRPYHHNHDERSFLPAQVHINTFLPSRNDNNTINNNNNITESPDETMVVLTEEQIRESKRIQRIARDMLAIKKYDLSIMVPRHISQERDELFIASNSPSLSGSGIQEVPSHLQSLPRDANYLVDVFFANAYYYYPVLNRTAVELCLMEPQTPQALFLLNIIFMTACKHLGRTGDIRRAIQFRERARELHLRINANVRLSRLQGVLLGSLVIYGVFKAPIGLAEVCGGHYALPTLSSSSDDEEDDFDSSSAPQPSSRCEANFPDLQTESQSIQAKRGVIPEAAYQARLWTFWGFYVRDSISRLYFGWPHGINTMAVTADIPKIDGCVGLGGKDDSPMSGMLSGQATPSVVIGKRRDTSFRGEEDLDGTPREKRQQLTHTDSRAVDIVEAVAKATTRIKADRAGYRSYSSSTDDDDEYDIGNGENDDGREEDHGNDHSTHGKPKNGRVFGGIHSEEEGNSSTDQDRGERIRIRLSKRPHRSRRSQRTPEPFSALSPKLLEEQSRYGNIPSIQRQSLLNSSSSLPLSSPLSPHFEQQKFDRHMERMKLLLAAEEDTTDGGSYARILFLQEIKLWSLGRRVALYLAGRTELSAPFACQKPTTLSSNPFSAGPHNERFTQASSHSFTAAAAARHYQQAGQWSELAWEQDYELQSLQTDLIAWEKAIPGHLRFRADVEQEDVNHKVNGKMGILLMCYYTISIMLQGSYLPIQQGSLSRQSSSRARNGSPQTASTSRFDSAPASPGVATMGLTISGLQPQEKMEKEEKNKEEPTTYQGYFNTPHRLCSEISNVLLHHVEFMLDSYPQWCTIQAKINHVLTAALRVSCLNAKLSSNPIAIREEAKAEFKMGSDLFKRLALLPYPLTIRDWPVEEDVQLVLDIEEEFKDMMMTQEEQQDTTLPSSPKTSEATEITTPTEADQIMTKEWEGTTTIAATISSSTGKDTTAVAAEEEGHSGLKRDRGFVARQHIFGLEKDVNYKFHFRP
ncbi:hypothetical protein BGZ65_008619 [Modicella reniformis]|uniref:Zn(2)-C6 fungal-type domain-containing protein n=1 Tax=Modicella reniformis TaxID=1440133 RepID=A0A9P6LSZ6_9FUNG|nr:hypothetical protein BGZ65_008619 [Modicella reniformis]